MKVRDKEVADKPQRRAGGTYAVEEQHYGSSSQQNRDEPIIVEKIVHWTL